MQVKGGQVDQAKREPRRGHNEEEARGQTQKRAPEAERPEVSVPLQEQRRCAPNERRGAAAWKWAESTGWPTEGSARSRCERWFA